MEENKISLPEIIIITGIVVTSDLIEFVVDLTGIGIIFGVIINFLVGGLIQIYLFFKGVKGFWKLGTNIIGAVLDGVFASFLPIKTITWIITVILVNKGEEVLEHAGVVGEIGKKLAQKGGKLGKIGENLQKI